MPTAGADPLVWVLAQMVKGRKIGERIVPAGNLVQSGDWGLHDITDSEGVTRPCLLKRVQVDDIPAFCDERIHLARAAEACEGEEMVCADDVRTMEIRYGVNGERLRSFRESISEMQEVEFPDFPLMPRTTLAYLKAVASVGESCLAQHLQWVAQSKIPEGDRAIHEDELLARVLDAAVMYDGLNVANLASFELVVRRKQLLAEAHVYNPGAPSYDGADHFMGTTYRPGGAIIVPALTEHVSRKMHEESQILKERRKIKESKGTGRGKPDKPPKTPDGGGKGGGSK